MAIFDLLFIALLLAAAGTLLTAAVFAIRGRGACALRIVVRLAVCAFTYMGIVAISSAFVPRRTLSVGELDCFDDWCIGVESSSRSPAASQGKTAYRLTLRLASRARRVEQREQNVVVYLTDENGKRYDPLPDASAVPINVLLHPGESVLAKRTFEVPAEARRLGAVIGHEGGFPIGWFIIGDDTWFRKPDIVPLP